MAGDGSRNEAHPVALRLWTALSRAHAAVLAHAAEGVARHGLTLAELGVLEALHDQGPLLLGEVQRLVLVSSGGTTYLVDRLESRGLVERRECPGDRRARLAALTPAGETLVRDVLTEHAARIKAAVAGLGKKERREAIRLLRILAEHASQPDDPESTA